MSGRIPDAFIDELLQRVDIVDVVGARIALKRAGKEYQARCPFHDERTPSFKVVPQKQFFHCFGCGAHGSAIQFLMNYEGLSFPDAVEVLAAQVGMKVPRSEGRAAADDRLAALYAILAEAATFFREELVRSEAARAYLERRGISSAMVERYGLGYAPNRYDALSGYLGQSPERMKRLIGAGLVSQRQHGAPYDKFRDRLMFPIHDRRGRPIAFGGRVIGEGEPKYLNSPETPLFHKGRELYGLWQARQSAQKLKRLVVVEGYMDVVALAQAGVEEVVATLGTAITREQVELLFRNAEDVIYCFDGDRAGRQAAWRALQATLPRLTDGRQAFFLFLPEGEDPDTLVRAEGVESFRRRLDAATALSDYFFATLVRDVDLNTVEGRARLAARATPLIESMPDGTFRDLMRAALAEKVGSRRQPPASTPAPPAQRPGTKALQRTLVRSAIALLLARPQLLAEVELPAGLDAVDRPGAELLRGIIARIQSRPRITSAELLQSFAGDPAFEALSKLAVVDLPGDEQAWRADLSSALQRLVEQHEAGRLQVLQRKSAAGLSALEPGEREELRRLLARKAGGRWQS
jgi:DNA primase